MNPSGSPTLVTGAEAGQHMAQLVRQACGEGWNPIPSVTFQCVRCESSISLTQGLLSCDPFVFIHPNGQCQPLEDPLQCSKCGAGEFHVTVRPTTFREWLRGILVQASPSDQDPAVGFREDQTGQMVRDSTLRKALTFDDLWQAIAMAVDPQGDINPRYTFNIIGVRYLDRGVPGIAHHNRARNILTTIIKDRDGNYWYSVER